MKLSHQYSPAELIELNEKLEALIAEEELDEKRLASLMSERDKLVQSYLAQLESSQIKQFAEAEIDINQKLISWTEERRTAVLQQTVGWLRGRKSVKKYK